MGASRRGQPVPDLSRDGDRLVPHVKEMGFSHIELLPVMEHPFSGSWAIRCWDSSRRPAGSAAEDFKLFVDACTRPASASFSTGCPDIFRKTTTAWRFDGTASTSTRTHGRASIATGGR